MNLKYFLVLFFALSSTAVHAAKWKCEGACSFQNCSSDYTGSMFFSVEASGSTESQARSALSSKCEAPFDFCTSSRVGSVYCNPEAAPAAPTYTIIFKNNCRKHGEIWTAIHYLDTNDEWKTEGYWNLAYGETATVAVTSNRIFEIHGHTDNDITWGGGEDSRQRSIRDSKRSFGRREIPRSVAPGKFTFNFTCGEPAPSPFT
jgi:hypothetical protein